MTLKLSIVKLLTSIEYRRSLRENFEKLIFSAFRDGMETLYTQFMLFGYGVGNPGLVKVLFTTEPHPIKSDSNFTRRLVFSYNQLRT